MTHRLTRTMLPLAGAFLAAGALLAPLAAQRPRPRYQRDLPAALLKQARVPEHVAAQTAAAHVRNGQIRGVELENENGKLIYSYELKVPGHSGIEEVNVDARTGAIVNTEHEGPGAESREAAEEAGGHEG